MFSSQIVSVSRGGRDGLQWLSQSVSQSVPISDRAGRGHWRLQTAACPPRACRSILTAETVLVNIPGDARLAAARYYYLGLFLPACVSWLFNHARWEMRNILPGTWYREASATTPTSDRMERLMESRNVGFNLRNRKSPCEVRPGGSEWTGRGRPCPPRSPRHGSRASWLWAPWPSLPLRQASSPHPSSPGNVEWKKVSVWDEKMKNLDPNRYWCVCACPIFPVLFLLKLQLFS